MRLRPSSDLILPTLMMGTYLFLPLIYLLLLSSPIFKLDSLSRETATTLIILILLIHIYTFGIGYLIYRAIKRRKKYSESLKGEGESLPMYNLLRGDGDRLSLDLDSVSHTPSNSSPNPKTWTRSLFTRERTNGPDTYDDDNNREAEILPLYNSPSPSSPYSNSNADTIADWVEANSADIGSAAKYEWEDQTVGLRRTSTSSSNMATATATATATETWVQTTRNLMFDTRGGLLRSLMRA
ncbi:hypothetical protein FKW77_004416 [Venturia effusa]|uniref:Uncharacterized protein n=1 Tax=Venturia effusa TaxID=50376 RepID=A0A517LK38_9PEZI|nr:hypothetical protein FKW77_004416 [Venturia effusa]